MPDELTGLDRMLEQEEAEITAFQHEHPLRSDDPSRVDNLLEEAKPESSDEDKQQGEVKEQGEIEQVEDKPKDAEAEPEHKVETTEPTKVEQVEQDPSKRPWTVLRQTQREKEALELKLKEQEAELKKLKETTPEAEFEEDDPLTKLQKETEQLKTRIARNEQEARAARAREAVVAEEQAFVKEYPDYHDAVAHIEQVQRKEFSLTGQLEAKTEEFIRNFPDVIETNAKKFGLDERKIAEELAFHVLMDQRKAMFMGANQGRVASAAYELAQSYGYQPKTHTPKTNNETVSRDRVLKAKEQGAVTQSISAMQSSGGGRDRKITTRAQLMQLSENERDTLIDEMDAQDPNWISNLE